MWIEPAGFTQVHDRGATETHRLKDPSKWVPYGVGAIEGRTAEGAPDGSLPVLESGAPAAEHGPGEEPRPADGQPTATANHELL
jgi:hypothetical protein